MLASTERVLKPGCTIEIIDQNFQIYTATSNSIPSSPTSTKSQNSSIIQEDELLNEIFDSAFDPRFINVHTLSIIPSQLSQNYTGVKSSGTVSVPYFSTPPRSTSSAIPHKEFEIGDGAIFESSAIGRENKGHKPSSEISRIRKSSFRFDSNFSYISNTNSSFFF